MVLNFGGVPNTLFPQSKAAGEGLGGDVKQKVIIEAGAGIIPIGGIIAWCKSFSGVPSLETQELQTLFVECDGSVLDDPDSPLDGQTIPDLNGANNRFLRGDSTSGGTGGNIVATANGNTGYESTHTHGVGAHNHTGSVSGTTGTDSDYEGVNDDGGKLVADHGHDHTFSDSFTVSTDPAFDTDAGTSHRHSFSDTVSIVPRYYEVVWLMRVK